MSRNQHQIVIGIDPDVDRSGIAVLELPSRNIQATALPFADVLDCLRSQQRRCEITGSCLMVVVEAGWLNKGNWHVCRNDSRQMASAKGVGIGRNQEVGILILELCHHWQIPCVGLRPLPLRIGRANLWSGKDGKITAEELRQVTGLTARTNQEARDAALLAWSWAKLPVTRNSH